MNISNKFGNDKRCESNEEIKIETNSEILDNNSMVITDFTMCYVFNHRKIV